MKNTLLILLILSWFSTHAQPEQQSINEQVWKPFTKAIMTQDHQAFIALHSTDLVRAECNDKKVLNYSEYKKRMENSWPQWSEHNKKESIQYTFELRFTERMNNGSLAFETGYFKNETTTPSGEKNISYGKFQVALRKENGIWKILVDSDTDEGGSITEKDFLAADSLE